MLEFHHYYCFHFLGIQDSLRPTFINGLSSDRNTNDTFGYYTGRAFTVPVKPLEIVKYVVFTCGFEGAEKAVTEVAEGRDAGDVAA